jgi:hypothetical protein
MFPVSKTALSMANQTSTCLTAFGMCRKYQDTAGSAITTCTQNSTAMVSKLKVLTTNNQSINAAQGGLLLLLLGSQFERDQALEINN